MLLLPGAVVKIRRQRRWCFTRLYIFPQNIGTNGDPSLSCWGSEGVVTEGTHFFVRFVRHVVYRPSPRARAVSHRLNRLVLGEEVFQPGLAGLLLLLRRLQAGESLVAFLSSRSTSRSRSKIKIKIKITRSRHRQTKQRRGIGCNRAWGIGVEDRRDGERKRERERERAPPPTTTTATGQATRLPPPLPLLPYWPRPPAPAGPP